MLRCRKYSQITGEQTDLRPQLILADYYIQSDLWIIFSLICGASKNQSDHMVQLSNLANGREISPVEGENFRSIWSKSAERMTLKRAQKRNM